MFILGGLLEDEIVCFRSTVVDCATRVADRDAFQLLVGLGTEGVEGF